MDLDKNIEDFDLIFLDLETTGLDAVTGDSICEIGAFRIKTRKIVDQFHSLINPKKNIPQEAYNVHKISDEDVKNAPYFEDVIDSLISFLAGGVICAYNVDFDMGFIDNHLKRSGYSPLDLPALDILSMARDALRLPKYNLAATAQFFNIDCSGGLHRALEDASVAYKIFFKLLDMFKERKVEKLEDFISLYGFNNEIFKVKENQKISLLKEAIDKRESSKIRYLSFANIVEEEVIMPLRVLKENNYFCLLYQGKKETSSQIRLGRVLKIASA
jgi:DNA polymerase III epsilon subunit family exonuclease